jgi:hypothetical protein
VIYIQAPFELILNVNSAVLAFLRREGKSELATGVNRQTEGGRYSGAPRCVAGVGKEILRDQSSFPIYLTYSVVSYPSVVLAFGQLWLSRLRTGKFPDEY